MNYVSDKFLGPVSFGLGWCRVGLVLMLWMIPVFALAQAGAATPAEAVARASEASRVESGLNATAQAGGLGNFCVTGYAACLTRVAGNVVRTLLSLSGLVLLGYLLYAGFLWMTSGGETEKAKEAMTMIRNAIIGLVILASAFAISSFVLKALENIATGSTPDSSVT